MAPKPKDLKKKLKEPVEKMPPHWRFSLWYLFVALFMLWGWQFVFQQ